MGERGRGERNCDLHSSTQVGGPKLGELFHHPIRVQQTWQKSAAPAALTTIAVSHASCGTVEGHAHVDPTILAYATASGTQNANCQAQSATASASTPFANGGAGE